LIRRRWRCRVGVRKVRLRRFRDPASWRCRVAVRKVRSRRFRDAHVKPKGRGGKPVGWKACSLHLDTTRRELD